MKTLAILVVGVWLILSPAMVAQEAPKPGPEQKRMENFVGKWTCDFEGVIGEQTCEWFAGKFFVVCSYKQPNYEFRAVMGYNRHEKAYTMFRYFSNGGSDFSKGWIRDKTWTWVFEDVRRNDKLRRAQLTAKEETADVSTFKWERSVEGEPWQVTQEGKCTKVKD